MRDQGYITKKAYKTAKKSNTTVVQNQRDFYNYEVSYAIDCAVEALMKQDGFDFHYSFSSVKDYKDYRKRYLEEYDLMRKELYTGGYKVKTTIDCNAQEKLQKAVDSNLAQFTKKQKDGEFLVQGAATVVDNITGKVVAIVGGRTQKSEEGNGRTLNRAFQSYNQPGSTIKPLVVYTPAFEKGYNPDTIVNDQKFDGGPSNSDGLYKGLIKVSQAVIESRNTVAWQILDDISPKTGLKYVQSMNFSHIVPSDYYDAAALGGLTYGVNTVEMASGYATIKNGGIYRKSTCIDSIEDSEGNEVKAGEMPSRVYKQYATKEITEIMQDVIKKGTGRGLSLERGMPSAGKTGTTNNQRSGWFCGFSPYYSIAVWVGTDNNDEVKDLWGGTYPGNIWKDSMNALCSGKTVVPFDTTLTQSDLLEKSGKSANSSTATTEKKAATTATTESNNSEEEDDDIVSRLNDLIYDYEDAEIQNDSDLAKIDSIESEIEDLLTKLKTKDNKNFYRKVYKQAKGEVQKKINQYRSSLGGSSTQTPTDQTTSNTTTESTEGDNSSGSTTESNVVTKSLVGRIKSRVPRFHRLVLFDDTSQKRWRRPNSLKESHNRNTLTVQELWDMAEHYDFNPKNFEIFKSNTCHTVKRLGNKGFIDEIVNKEYIEIYWNNKNRLCACYLLAMIDYLCRLENLPLIEKFDCIRGYRLPKLVYPYSFNFINNEDLLDSALAKAIPEFYRHGLVEGDVFNVC